MGGVEVMVAISFLIAFIGGIAIGVVAIVSVASKREDRLYSLMGEPPDAVCRGVRRLLGVYTRGGWPVGQVLDQGGGAPEQQVYR
jgi:hypothetical protein